MFWNRFRLISAPALCCSLALIITGCGQPSLGVYPVEGKLLIDDQPAVRASIAFHSTDKTKVLCPVGVTDADGTYRLTTFAANDGAPAGGYIVTVIWPDESVVIDECERPSLTEHDRLGGRYANPRTSSLRATVRPEMNRIVFHAEEDPRWRRPPGAKSPTVRAILKSAQTREAAVLPTVP